MKKRVLKCITILVSLIMILSVSQKIYAASTSVLEADGISVPQQTNKSTSNFDVNAWEPTSDDNNSSMIAMGNTLIAVIRTIGSVVSVIVLIVLGIKYMMASVNEKADLKKALIPYVIGAILIFATTNLASIIYDIVNGL